MNTQHDPLSSDARKGIGFGLGVIAASAGTTASVALGAWLPALAVVVASVPVALLAFISWRRVARYGLRGSRLESGERLDPLSANTQGVIIFTGVLVVLAHAVALIAVFAGPGPALAFSTPALAVAIPGLVAAWRGVVVHGWRAAPSGEDEGSDGGGGTDGDDLPSGPDGGIEFDWDAFTTEFWAHVESRERELSLTA
jgi:hypothetical protein